MLKVLLGVGLIIVLIMMCFVIASTLSDNPSRAGLPVLLLALGILGLIGAILAWNLTRSDKPPPGGRGKGQWPDPLL